MNNQNKSLENPETLRFEGESRNRIFLQLIVIIPFSGFILLAFFLSFNVIGKLILIALLLSLLYLILKKGIKSVTFKKDCFTVKRIIGSQKTYSYDDVLGLIVKKQANPYPALFLGHLDNEIVNIKFKNSKGKRRKPKIYFYCPPDRKEQLSVFLKDRKIRWIDKVS